jgi:hypothetical protein
MKRHGIGITQIQAEFARGLLQFPYVRTTDRHEASHCLPIARCFTNAV